MQHRDRSGRFTPVGLSRTSLISQLVRYSEIRILNTIQVDLGGFAPFRGRVLTAFSPETALISGGHPAAAITQIMQFTPLKSASFTPLKFEHAKKELFAGCPAQLA